MVDVSIIIATYNRLWCLPQAINSCRNTLCKTEIIVINDGSTDGTREWLEIQPEIKIINQNNWGKCWSVNKGFEIATGKYIRILDSDDRLSINAIDEQFFLAEANQSDIVVSGYTFVDENERIIRKQPWIYCDDFLAQQLGECDSSHYSAYLFRKEFIKEFSHRPDFSFRDDRLFIIEIALKNPTVSIHPGCALIHKKHNNGRLQITSGMQNSVQNYQHLKLYEKILNILQETNCLTPRRLDASLNILWPLAHWIAKKHLTDAVMVVEWIYKLKPNFQAPEKGILGAFYKTFGFKTTEKILKFRRSIFSNNK